MTEVAATDGRPPAGARRDRAGPFAVLMAICLLPHALRLLAGLPRRGRKRLSLDRIDGVASLDSPHLERFLASGFERDYTSLVAAQETGGRPASSRHFHRVR